MKNNGNVVNIKKLMHENASIKKARGKDEFRVSPTAVHEYSSRVVDHIGDIMPEICKIAQKDGRKTVMEQDVIQYFGHVGADIIEY